MINRIFYGIFIVFLIDFAFSQSNRELESILNKSGISKSQAEKIIKNRLPSNISSNQNTGSSGIKTKVGVNNIEKSVSNNVAVNSKVVNKPVWDPPVVAFDKHINKGGYYLRIKKNRKKV